MDVVEWVTLFAQDSGNLTGTWVGLGGSVLNIGFAAVVGWYLLTKALPHMQEQYLASQREQREAFMAEINHARRFFDEREVRNQTEAKAALNAVIASHERESHRRDELLRTELATIHQALRQQMEAFEEFRERDRDREERNR